MLELRRLELGPMANFVYLLADAKSGECAVVDPAWDVPAILDAVEKKGWRLSRVLVTHRHHDHVNGVPELLKLADLPVHVHARDAGALAEVRGSLRPVQGGERIRVGSVELEVLHTPGHTAGSLCFLAQDRLLTGDTLFVGTCGRVDLPDSDPELMYGSLKRIAELPGRTEVLPGHDYGPTPTTTVETEASGNLYLRTSVKEPLHEFLKLVGA